MAEDDLCVAQVPIFQDLSRDEQLNVARYARPMSVSKGEAVVTPGQSGSRLLVLHRGQLKASHVAANGREQVLRTLTVGDVVGERAFLTGREPDEWVVALEDSQMCVFDHADLTPLLREHPEIGEQMLRVLSDRLVGVERLLGAITSSDVGARTALYVLDLPARVRDGVAWVRLPMAKHDVAAFLGTTPESLSRSLASFADAGAIELHGRRDIAILDRAALERVATA